MWQSEAGAHHVSCVRCLDAAFKQYEHTAGLPIAQDVPFDSGSFVDELLASAQVDEEAGTIQGIDTALIESRFETYLNDVNQYIDSQHPEATVGEVIGTRTIRPRQAPLLVEKYTFARKEVSIAIDPELCELLMINPGVAACPELSGEWGSLR